jgi:hypothetical protein
MPMVPRLAPSPVLKAARPHKVLAWLAVPDLAPALVTLPAPDRATKPRPVAAALAVALAQAPATLPALVPVPALEAEAEAAPVEVISPVLGLATLLALVPAISLAEAVGTRSQFGGE